LIIGLTGLARAGKDTVAAYLVEKYGFKHLDFYRDVLLEKAKERGIESKDKMAMSILGDELRKEGGRGILAKFLAEKIVPENDYVITGFRSPEEVDFIRNEFQDFVLVEVRAGKLNRFSRRKDTDPDDINAFFERDKRDIQNKGLGEVLRMADYVIDNDGTIEELKSKIDELMKKVMA